jgi:hypothetical protein
MGGGGRCGTEENGARARSCQGGEQGRDAVTGVAGDVEVLDEGEREPALRRIRESTESVGRRQ